MAPVIMPEVKRQTDFSEKIYKRPVKQRYSDTLAAECQSDSYGKQQKHNKIHFGPFVSIAP